MEYYTEQFKEAMVKKLVGPKSQSAGSLSRETGVATSTLCKWKKNYATVSEGGPDMRKKRPKQWSAQEKLNTIMVYEALDEEQKGVYVRKHGLHATEIERWKEDFLQAYAHGDTTNRGRKQDPKEKRIRALEKELNKKDKALAETAALLTLKKKAHLIWGDSEEEK